MFAFLLPRALFGRLKVCRKHICHNLLVDLTLADLDLAFHMVPGGDNFGMLDSRPLALACLETNLLWALPNRLLDHLTDGVFQHCLALSRDSWTVGWGHIGG